MPNYKDLSSGELQRLASQGDRDAYYWLGEQFSKCGDKQSAAMWWEKAVKRATIKPGRLQKSSSRLGCFA